MSLQQCRCVLGQESGAQCSPLPRHKDRKRSPHMAVIAETRPSDGACACRDTGGSNPWEQSVTTEIRQLVASVHEKWATAVIGRRYASQVAITQTELRQHQATDAVVPVTNTRKRAGGVRGRTCKPRTYCLTTVGDRKRQRWKRCEKKHTHSAVRRFKTGADVRKTPESQKLRVKN